MSYYIFNDSRVFERLYIFFDLKEYVVCTTKFSTQTDLNASGQLEKGASRHWLEISAKFPFVRMYWSQKYKPRLHFVSSTEESLIILTHALNQINCESSSSPSKNISNMSSHSHRHQRSSENVRNNECWIRKS